MHCWSTASMVLYGRRHSIHLGDVTLGTLSATALTGWNSTRHSKTITVLARIINNNNNIKFKTIITVDSCTATYIRFIQSQGLAQGPFLGTHPA